MTSKDSVSVRERQDPLRRRYKETPGEALITDRAKTTGGVDTDPFHGCVIPGNSEHGVAWPFGIHRAVGGFSDAPNPGDILCAAVATCLDATIRIIANRLGITLTALEVEVTADVDVRGTLLVDRNVSVGFQAMRCHVDVRSEDGTDLNTVKKLVAAAEASCVNLQTLLANVSVQTSVSTGGP